jgi:hypothetical protein
MSKGYIYVLSNPSMPGLLKIGRTSRSVEQRAAELSSATGVPEPFNILFSVLVPDCISGEVAVHSRFEFSRHNTSKEFFKADATEVMDFLCGEVLIRQLLEYTEEFAPGMALIATEDVPGKGVTAALRSKIGVRREDLAGVILEIDDEAIKRATESAILRHRERNQEFLEAFGYPEKESADE